MKTPASLLGAILLAGIFATSLVHSAKAAQHHKHDQTECTVAILNGTYGFTVSGTIVGVGPVGGVGTTTYDGNGNLSTQFTQSRNGEIFRGSATGTYAVNSDCTGFSAVSGGRTFDFVILDGGNEVASLLTIPGLVLPSIQKKQFPEDDDNK